MAQLHLRLAFTAICSAAVSAAFGQTADKITVITNDQVSNPSPSAYGSEVRFHIKWNASIGVPHIGSPGPGTYSTSMTVAPWTDGSGPKHHQINFNEEGLYWRKGAIGASWESWRKVVTTESNGTIVHGTTSNKSVSTNGLIFGYNQTSIEFLNSDWGNGFASRLYGTDEGNGVTSFRIAVRGNTASWTDALYIRAANTNDPRVGIGTNTPMARFHVLEPAVLPQVTGSFQILYRITGKAVNNFSRSEWLLRDAATTEQWWTTRLHDGISIDGSFETPRVDTRTWWERDPYDDIQAWGNANNNYMTLKSGKLGIGTINPDEQLTVKGKIHAEEVRVDTSVPVPDYVFDSSYDLPSLSSVESYINENKHLPEIPSAKEIEANGLKLGEMEMLLLKKIEELTLHIISQQKQIESLSQEVKSLKNH